MWGELAKMARKNGVWDVAVTAATFCVEHNASPDGRRNGKQLTAPYIILGQAELRGGQFLIQYGCGYGRGRHFCLSDKIQ